MILNTFLSLSALLSMVPFDEPVYGTMSVDVVGLIDSKSEVKGDPSITADHEGHRYRFASDANRAAFLKNPLRYEVQFGGACGKMGPLTGHGSPDRYAVVEGKIYLFASDGCRETFLKNHARLIDANDPMPSISSRDRERGKLLLEKVAGWAGGVERLLSVKEISERRREALKAGSKTYDHGVVFTTRFDGTAREDDRWDADTWSTVFGDEAYFLSPSGKKEPLFRVERWAFERKRNQRLHVVLRRALEPRARVWSSKEGELSVGFDGIVATLGVDPTSGTVKSMAYIGRGPKSWIGRIERSFTGYEWTGGLWLPSGWTATFDGVPEPSLDVRGLRYTVL